MLADCTSRILSGLASLRGWTSTSNRRTSAGGSCWLGPVERCNAGIQLTGTYSMCHMLESKCNRVTKLGDIR